MYCYVVGRNLINGQPEQFQVAEGAVFTENYNETLDSGTIILDHLTRKIEIEPFDTVYIANFGAPTQITPKYMCVDTYECTQISLNPPVYKYEIQLFSETKLLEGVLLPNLSITKLFGRTRYVMYYLDQYLDLYGEKTSSNSETGAYGNKWSYSQRLRDKFSAIECPEFQWNEPTLREVLTDLMMVGDCIPVMKNNIIDYIDISQTGSEISNEQKSGINFIRESHSSADYVSELKMNLVNAANGSVPTGEYVDIDDSDVPSDHTRIVERMGFRNNESYLLNTNNIELQTSFPIWKLFLCNLVVYMNVRMTAAKGSEIRQVTQLKEVKVPLKNSTVDFIPEYREWLTKDVFYGDWGQYAEFSTQYRNTCLYYTRGGKNISNFNGKYQQQFLWISDTQYVLELIFKSDQFNDALDEVGREMYEESGLEEDNWWYASTTTVETPTWKDCMFEVAYEPIDECVFRASKSPFQRHKRQVVDNQNTSYVDIKKQGFLEYMKANRLGNKMSLINGRYSAQESFIPSLSQKVNGNIIFQKQMTVFYDHIDVNYLATENYVLRDYFTGVKSKLRTWRVLEGNQAFVRAESMKFYVNNSISSVNGVARKIPSYSSLQTYLERFRYCALRFNTSDGYKPASTKYGNVTYATNYMMVEFSKHIVGNSVVFTFRMIDNAYNGNYISNYFGTDNRCEQKGISYTDNNGELTSVEIRFYDECDTYWYDPNFGWPYSIAAIKGLRPLVCAGSTWGHLNNDHLVFKCPLTVNKDNKEILQISIQFEMNEDANDMFLGHKD